MSDSPLCLDARFSTTRSVTTIRPEILSHPGDRFETMLFLPNHPARTAEGGLRTQGYFKLNEPDKPLISVITVVFNGEKYLEQTIRSVIEQSYDNVEYLIIDGGSTDGTLDIIKRYDGQIDYWVSEPDEGISDAFNKGISLCTGEMIGIINADDWYELTTIDSLTPYLNKYDVIYGKMTLWTSNNNAITPYIDHNTLKKNMTLCHPSVFISRKSYKQHGTYNDTYRYAMDYDLLLRLYLKNIDFCSIRKIFANMRDFGISNKMWIPAMIEVKESKTQNGISKINSYSYLCFYILKRILRISIQRTGASFIVDYYRKFTFQQ